MQQNRDAEGKASGVRKSYFDLVGGSDDVFDEEGIRVPDLQAAINVATRSAFEIMAADIVEGRLDLRPCIYIKDDTGVVVHVVRFCDLIEVIRPKLN